jgi:hypothetical protein
MTIFVNEGAQVMSDKPHNIAKVIIKGSKDTLVSNQPVPESRVIHHFGDKLSIVQTEKLTTDDRFVEALPTDLDVSTMNLNKNEQLVLAALQLSNSKEYLQAKQSQSSDGKAWGDVEEGDWQQNIELKSAEVAFKRGDRAPISGAEGGSLNARMVGQVVVSVIFVEGPTPDTAISFGDRIKVIAECLDGLSFFVNQASDANLSFLWDIRSVSLDVHPGEGGNWGNLPVAFQSNLDAVVERKDNGKIYFFKGNEYVRLTENEVDANYPKPIANNWRRLPAQFQQNIDAALYRESNNKLYFFSDNRYVRLTGSTMDDGYPKTIAGNWRGLPRNFNNGIDAALWYQPNGKIYFFKGDEYVRMSGSTMDPGYPRKIKNAWAIPDAWSDIDAALMRSNGKIYFFRRQAHIRLSSANALDPGFPKAIANEEIDREGLWRDPAMASLGYDPGKASVNEFLRGIRDSRNTQWAFAAFFTRYPLANNGYARRPNSFVVMSVDNGARGMDKIDAVFAHETGHIFGAPDEYKKPRVNCDSPHGFFHQPNNNSVHCAVDLQLDEGPNNISPIWPRLPMGWRSNLDAVLAGENNKKYFFKAGEYLRFTGEKVDSGYPKPIAGNWEGLPAEFEAGIDAAFMDVNAKVYFFSGSQYVCLTEMTMDEGFPRFIRDDWQGLPVAFNESINAALLRNNNQKIYFFKDDQYVRIDSNFVVEPGYPKNIAGHWPGLPDSFENGIQAAINNGNGKIDLFDGAQFVRYIEGKPCIMRDNTFEICKWTRAHLGWEAFLTKIDVAFWRISNNRIYLFSGAWYVRMNNNIIDGPEQGYPKKLTSGWGGLPNAFKSGIDAALMNESNGKLYFFKGSEYVRIGDNGVVEAGYPRLIASSWRDLPEAFNQGIDAALMREVNGKVYFFKGAQYVRLGAGNRVDPGYPKPIAGHWSGAPADFNQGFDATLMNKGDGRVYAFKDRKYIRWTRVSDGIDDDYPKWIHGNWMAFPK